MLIEGGLAIILFRLGWSTRHARHATSTSSMWGSARIRLLPPPQNLAISSYNVNPHDDFGAATIRTFTHWPRKADNIVSLRPAYSARLQRVAIGIGVPIWKVTGPGHIDQIMPQLPL